MLGKRRRLDPRPYQLEALAAAKERNLLLVLPTNAGKTFIAAELISSYLQKEDGCKIVFLAPNGPLVEQQCAVLQQECSLCDQDDFGDASDKLLEDDSVVFVSAVHGGMTDKDRKRGKRARVLVSTPELLLKDLIHAEVRMKDIGLLVLDEAHHCAGKDHYSLLMQRFYLPLPPSERPRILAMTASPFKFGKGNSQMRTNADIEKYLSECVEQVLDCAVWVRSVEEYLPQTKQERREFRKSEVSSTAARLRDALQESMDEFVPEQKAGSRAWWALRTKLEEVEESLGIWAAYTFLKALVGNGGTQALSLRDVLTDASEADDGAWRSQDLPEVAVGEALARCLSKFEKIEEVSVELQAKPQDFTSSKALVLEGVVKDALAEGTAPKILIFTRMRLTAKLLFEYLSREDSPVAGRVGFVASTRPGSKLASITIMEQQERLAQFRLESTGDAEGLDVLVCTSVLGEGINVASCSLVIRFDPPATVLDNIQTRGRARRDGAVYMHLIEDGDEKHRELLEEFDTMEDRIREVMQQRHAENRSRLDTPQQEEDPEDVLSVPSTGAKLPKERAKNALHEVYVSFKTHSQEAYFFSAEEFLDKTHFQTTKTADDSHWQCTVTLPVVGCCTVRMEQQEQITGSPSSSTAGAKSNAAMAAMRYLHSIGVLDDRLNVAGREEILAEMGGLLNLRGSSRVRRKDDQWALKRRQDVVRSLPACLRENFERTEKGIQAYAYIIEFPGDELSKLGLLLPRPLPQESLPIIVDMLNGSGPQSVKLEALPTLPIYLFQDELQLLEDWTQCGLVFVGATSVSPRQSKVQLRMRPMAGDYTVEPQEKSSRSDSAQSGESEAHWLVAPINEKKTIDWNLVHWCVDRARTADWQHLDAVLQQEVNPQDGKQESEPVLTLSKGVQTRLGELIVLHSASILGDAKSEVEGDTELATKICHKGQSRQLVFGDLGDRGSNWALTSAAYDDESEDPQHGRRGVEFVRGSLFRRSVASAASSSMKMVVNQLLKVTLPASACRILPLLYGHYCSLQRLPGLLWRLEHVALTAEVAAALATMNVTLPLSMQVQSLTHPGSAVLPLEHPGDEATGAAPPAEIPGQAYSLSYERLEFLGDAVLKLLAIMQVARTTDRLAGEDSLAKGATELQTNRYLHKVSKALLKRVHGTCENFGEIMLVNAFQTGKPLSHQRRQQVSVKMQADVVEALLGASFQNVDKESRIPALQQGIEEAHFFFRNVIMLTRLDSDRFINFESAVKITGLHRFTMRQGDKAAELSSQPTEVEQRIMQQLGYKFQTYKHLLTDICQRYDSEGARQQTIFQELEIIGDAVLQGLVSAHLMEHLGPYADEGMLSQARSDLVSNAWLARRMVRRFPRTLRKRFFQLASKEELRRVEDYIMQVMEVAGSEADAAHVIKEDFKAVHFRDAPKVVADLYEALVGAVFIDCHGDMETTWRVFQKDFVVPAKVMKERLQECRTKQRQESLATAGAVATEPQQDVSETFGEEDRASADGSVSGDSFVEASEVAENKTDVEVKAAAGTSEEEFKSPRERAEEEDDEEEEAVAKNLPEACPATEEEVAGICGTPAPSATVEAPPAPAPEAAGASSSADTKDGKLPLRSALKQRGKREVERQVQPLPEGTQRWCIFCQSTQEVMSHFDACFTRQPRKWSDARSCLNYLQQKNGLLAAYNEGQKDGVDHLPKFTCVVTLRKANCAAESVEGMGPTKKTAAAEGAEQGLAVLRARGLPMT